MGAYDSRNIETYIPVDENEMFSLPALTSL